MQAYAPHAVRRIHRPLQTGVLSCQMSLHMISTLTSGHMGWDWRGTSSHAALLETRCSTLISDKASWPGNFNGILPRRGRAGACCTTSKRWNMADAASTAAEWKSVVELSRCASVSSSRFTGCSTGDTARRRRVSTLNTRVMVCGQELAAAPACPARASPAAARATMPAGAGSAP